MFQSELPEAPEPVLPEAFTAEAEIEIEIEGAALAAGDWLDDFQDPQLQALVEEALEHNRKFLGALARRDAASARYAAEFAGQLPRVDLQAQAQRQRFINDIITSSTTVIDQEAYPTRLVLGAGVNWELDLWGRVANQADGARAEAAAAALEVEAAGFSLAAQTTTQWFSLVVAEKRLELARRIAQSYEQTVQRSRERYERGLVTIVDLRQAMAEAEMAQSELLARKLDAGRTRRSLEVLLGRYPNNELKAADGLPELPETPAAGVPGQLIERRPDVAAAELRLRSADARLLAAKKNLLPRFNISLFGGTQAKYRDLLFTEDSEVWSIGGNAVLPLFDGGAIKAGISGQRALLEEAVSQYQDKVLSACLEVEDTLAAEVLLRSQIERARASLEQMRAVVDSVEKRFELGLLDLRAVLAARRSAWQAEQRLLETELLTLNNRVALYLALGGGIAEGDEDEAGADEIATTTAVGLGEAAEVPADEAASEPEEGEEEEALSEDAALPVENDDAAASAPTAEMPTDGEPAQDPAVETPTTTGAQAPAEPLTDPLDEDESTTLPAPAETPEPAPVPAAATATGITTEPAATPDDEPAAPPVADEEARQRNLERLLATDPLLKSKP